MKKIIGLLTAGAVAAGLLIAAPALVPASSSASNPVASTALSLVSPDTAEAKKKKKKKLTKKQKAKAKAKAKKAKATKSEYKKIKRGMSLAKVRKIIGSKGKRSWYYEYTSSDYKCDDGYYTEGYWQPQETWVDGYWEDQGYWHERTGDWIEYSVWVEGYFTYEDVWVEGEWVEGECWDEDLTTTYADHTWKNDKRGSVYISFENGKVTSKSWYQ